jgi:hypothetical protein
MITTALDDDPFGDDILTDPYPFHQRLRDAAPVVELSRYGVWAMGRYSGFAAGKT